MYSQAAIRLHQTAQHSSDAARRYFEAIKPVIILSLYSLQNGSCRSQFQQKAVGVLLIIVLCTSDTAGKGGNRSWKLQQSHLLKIFTLKPW